MQEPDTEVTEQHLPACCKVLNAEILSLSQLLRANVKQFTNGDTCSDCYRCEHHSILETTMTQNKQNR